MIYLRGMLAGILVLVLAPAAAWAGGPGITLFSAQSLKPLTLSGDEIAAATDTGPTPYTLRATPGAPGQKLTLAGLSIRGLLVRAGLDPDGVEFISVVRANGSLAVLRRADFADPPPFPEGPALVTDDGTSTRFFRPVRALRGTNAADNIETAGAGPLEMTVDGGTLLAVDARAVRTRVKAGDTVRFSAVVRFGPPDAPLTYDWDFGDDTTGAGRTVTHTYAAAGDFQAQVSVKGIGGSGRCAQFCGGVDTIDIRVGDPPQQPKPPEPAPGAGTGNPDAPGSSAGGTAGSGGSGGGTTPGASGTPRAPAAKPPQPQKPKRKPKPAAKKKEPAPRKVPGGRTVTGVLLAGEPKTLTGKLPQPEQAAGSPRAQQSPRGGADDPAQIGGSALVALLAISLGALRERRRVTLRLS